MDETQKENIENTSTPEINIDNFSKTEKKNWETNEVFNLDVLAKKKSEVEIEIGKEDLTTEIFKTDKAIVTKEKREINKLLSDFQVILMGYLVIFLGLVWIAWTQIYMYYVNLQNQPKIEDTKIEFVQNIENAEKFVTKIFAINDFSNLREQTDLLLRGNTTTAVETIKYGQNLTYTEKRLILQNNVTALSDNIINNISQLTNVKSEITKYGFIPKELFELTKKEDGITGIRRAMALRENLKFMTAFKVFWYMESFIQGFANYSNISPNIIESNLFEINRNWEKSIISYTNNCYLNPYEIGSECNITNDFNNYYAIVDTKSKISADFIKQLASYTENKLEEKEYPSYTITFPGFNPKKTSIGFTTDISTNNQDEAALSKLRISNPHLFIITNLINSLKQSLLVIGEGIKIDQINIIPTTIRIGSTIWTINKSKLTFELPIQQTDQREIADFFNTQSSQ